MNLEEFLNREGVRFEKVHHREACKARDVADAEHIAPRKVAKTVVVKCEGEYFLLVLPADCLVDLDKASRAVDVPVDMATEGEMKRRFPGCEIGAEPPFGSLFGVPTFVDVRLAQEPEIIFRAGSHTETVKMAFKDFERLEKPKIADFAAS